MSSDLIWIIALGMTWRCDFQLFWRYAVYCDKYNTDIVELWFDSRTSVWMQIHALTTPFTHHLHGATGCWIPWHHGENMETLPVLFSLCEANPPTTFLRITFSKHWLYGPLIFSMALASLNHWKKLSSCLWFERRLRPCDVIVMSQCKHECEI